MNIQKVLLLCLSLACILTLPVQSQTATPTPPTQLQNPEMMSACGLPASHALFNSSATVITLDMNSDCAINPWNIPDSGTYLQFTSGEFTINGNGYSISGPKDRVILVNNSSTVLNLNDVVIRQSGDPGGNIITLQNGARLNGRNIIFSDNVVGSVASAQSNSRIYFENVQFLNNRKTIPLPQLGSAITVDGASTYPNTLVSITNGAFRGNTGAPEVIAVQSGILELRGCITFKNNVDAAGAAANDYQPYTNPTITDARKCPKPKTATPQPSPTPRPRAITCIDLNQATGIVIHATYGLDSGVQCQRLNGGGIGLRSIVDAGFIDAVDIWGYVEQGVEVCFPQFGRLLFLDARTMPRAVAPLASTVINGMTCGSIDMPGSIVLMPAG